MLSSIQTYLSIADIHLGADVLASNGPCGWKEGLMQDRPCSGLGHGTTTHSSEVIKVNDGDEAWNGRINACAPQTGDGGDGSQTGTACDEDRTLVV